MAESPTPIKCETVLIDMTDEQGNTTSVVIPAFTVGQSTLRLRLLDLVDEYMNRSTATANSVSLGDFALFLVSLAAQDPGGSMFPCQSSRKQKQPRKT